MCVRSAAKSKTKEAGGQNQLLYANKKTKVAKIKTKSDTKSSTKTSVESIRALEEVVEAIIEGA